MGCWLRAKGLPGDIITKGQERKESQTNTKKSRHAKGISDKNEEERKKRFIRKMIRKEEVICNEARKRRDQQSDHFLQLSLPL